ncbi:MAG: GspH/FimT family protein [Acidobacteria bacterium]|nr:GspH/FimT family protein [Acidobacteriota bacterium]
MGVLAAVAIPQLFTGLDRSRTWAAARYLASQMAVARSQAVLRSAHVALRFVEGRSGVTFQMFVDTNHNGVRTSDIEAAVDRAIDTPAHLTDLFPGVAIAIAPELGTDAVRVGSSDLLSFTPLGTATAGTIYVRGRDGTQLAVRVLGATARTRVVRYVPGARQWVETF